MSSVDNRIVNMKFDNASFERGVSTTIGSLGRLEQSLQFKDATKGLAGVQGAIANFHMGPIEGAITRVSSAFVAMSTVAITALSNITNRAIDAGANIAKSLTIDPISSGFSEYEQKMGAIQTIMAGSGENLKTVNKYLQELNTYSDKTIYSFSDMTQNIGKFTNAGISLKDSVASIKGVANVAALSGANAEEASRAMYNFAQALSSGAVRLQDWKSIELANMGTKEFKDQLIEAAVAAGTLRKTSGGMYETITSKKRMALSATEGFNDSLKEEWLTTEVLNKTLGEYSNANTDIGKRATAAAQDVKTFSQMLDTLKESAGSGWAETWELVFGNFKQGKKLWTGLSQFFGGFIERSAEARNHILKDWAKLDGRKNLFAGIKNVVGALGDVLRPVKEAFREIFPAMTGKRLAELTENFREFTEHLRLSEGTIENIKRTFKGLFAIFSIISSVISGAIGAVAKAIGALFSLSGSTSGGLLRFTGNVGDMISSFDEMLKKGKVIEKFFGALGTALAAPIKFIHDLAGAIGSLFTGKKNTFLDDMVRRFESLGPVLDTVRAKIQEFITYLKGLVGSFSLGDLFDFGGEGKKATGQIDAMQASLGQTAGVFDRIKAAASGFWNSIQTTFNKIREAVTGLFEGLNLQDVLALINTGFFIALFKTIKDLSGKIGGLLDSYSQMIDKAGGVLDQVTQNLKSMQAEVRADVIVKIAAALALLAVAIFILSKINPGSLAKSLVAVGALLAMMIASVKALEKATSMKGSFNLTTMAIGLIALAGAIAIMAGAVALFGMMDEDQLKRGLTSVGLILAAIVGSAVILSKTGGAGQLMIAAASITVLAVSLTVFAAALKLYSMLDTTMMLEGGLKIAAALTVIGLTMRAMPKNMLANAAALTIVAVALNILAVALKVMSTLSGGDTGQALTLLGGSLLIIALALRAMTGAQSGAASILLFAVALNMLIPPLLVLANLSLTQLGMALLGLVGIFAVLGIATVVLTPIIPLIAALGAAIALLGAAMLMAGAGMFLFAAGLAILATLGAGSIAVITGVIVAVAQLIPVVMEQIGLGIVAMAKVIGEKAPVIMEAIGKLLDEFIEFILEYAPKLYDAVFVLLGKFMDAVEKRVPEIAEKGANIVIAFIKAIGEQSERIIKAAGEMMLDFLEGITDWLNDNKDRIHDVGHDLAKAIIDGVIAGITGLGSGVGDALMGMARGAWDKVKGFFKVGSPSKLAEDLGEWIVIGWAKGIDNKGDMVADSMESAGEGGVIALKKTMKQMADAIATDLNAEPVIAPVLDLTKFRESAAEIQSMLATKPVTADVSFNQAASISSTSQQAASVETAQQNNSPIIFEQNNYSPKALTPIEIYRNTRNQLSLAKEVLAV